jgi:hypothetical protein
MTPGHMVSAQIFQTAGPRSFFYLAEYTRCPEAGSSGSRHLHSPHFRRPSPGDPAKPSRRQFCAFAEPELVRSSSSSCVDTL